MTEKHTHFDTIKEKAEKILARKKAGFDEAEYKDFKQILHDLQVHQVELEIQNDELKRTQDELEISRGNYKQLFDFSSQGIVLLDRAGIIHHANFTFGQWVGRQSSDIINTPFVNFIDEDDQPIFRGRYTSFYTHPELKTIEVRLKVAAGKAHFCLIRGHSKTICRQFESQSGASGLIAVSISDIHELKTAQLKERRLTQTIKDIVEKTPVGLCITDAKGVFEFVNRRLL